MQFKVNIVSANNNKFCTWATEDLTVSCAYNGVPTHCCKACSTCGSELCTDSTMDFKILGSSSWKSCTWVAEYDTTCCCGFEGMVDTCSQTCIE